MRIFQNDKKLGFLKQNLTLKKKTLSFENDDIHTDKAKQVGGNKHSLGEIFKLLVTRQPDNKRK